MPLAPNPTAAQTPASAVPEGPAEQLVAQWEEPVLPAEPIAANLPAIIGASALLVVLFILGGYFLHYGTLYLAAAVPLAVGFMLVAQARRPAPPRTITITDQRLLAGNRAYLLADLAGFWLRQEKGITIVNIEPNKPSPFPVSLLHPSDNAETVRALLLQSLPEVEQRATDVTDSLGKYIKL